MSEEPKEQEKHCCEHGQCGCSHHDDHHDGEHCRCSEESRPAEFPQDVPLPPPSLLTLATSIATQAMVSMGIFPHPITGKSEFMLHQARHLIDTIAMLNEKTQGNRTDEESKTLDGILHELHMLFIAAENEKTKRDSEAQA